MPSNTRAIDLHLPVPAGEIKENARRMPQND